mgnify:CR=1 FL=1
MKVSIIIPVYNVAPYIEKCLQSVADQTFHGTMECLLIDDCGQDESMALAEHFVSAYKGNIVFRIFHHERNRGLSAARNTGIENACGEWLYFLDSDDWIIPECIQLMMECVEKHPDTEAVFAGAVNDLRKWMSYETKNLPEFSEDRDWIQIALLKRTYLGMTAWNKLVRRNFIIENNCYFYEGMIHEDELWNFGLSRYLKCLSIVKRNTYIYEEHQNSIMSDENIETIWKNRIRLWNSIIDEIQGYRRNIQIEGICNFILNLTIKGSKISFPFNRRKDLFFIFIRLSMKSSFSQSFFMLLQGFLAFSYNRNYCNTKITKRIRLASFI